jgi:hypothetical protein
MDTFLYRTLLLNSVGIHQREFYCIKITSFKSSNTRVYQRFLALGNNFRIIGQFPNGPTPSYATATNAETDKDCHVLFSSCYFNKNAVHLQQMR